jgi:hypothetical protein
LPPVASSAPSGLKATDAVPVSAGPTGRRAPRSHSRAFSSPAAASSRPSGLKASGAPPVSGGPVDRPVVGSQNFTRPSSPAVASCFPSGLNVTSYTAPV